MWRRTSSAVLLLAVTSLVWAAGPALAHEGHTSCQASGQFAAGLARQLGPGFGAAASSLAQQGQADDFVEATHGALCEPGP
jgi:hypothetical protein